MHNSTDLHSKNRIFYNNSPSLNSKVAALHEICLGMEVSKEKERMLVRTRYAFKDVNVMIYTYDYENQSIEGN